MLNLENKMKYLSSQRPQVGSKKKGKKKRRKDFVFEEFTHQRSRSRKKIKLLAQQSN